MSPQLQSNNVESGDVLRVGIIQEDDKSDIVRVSLYRKGRHMVTMAVDDRKNFIKASEPPKLDAVATAFDSTRHRPPAAICPASTMAFTGRLWPMA